MKFLLFSVFKLYSTKFNKDGKRYYDPMTLVFSLINRVSSSYNVMITIWTTLPQWRS